MLARDRWERPSSTRCTATTTWWSSTWTRRGLSRLAGRYDVRTVTGRGTSRGVLRDAGAAEAELVIASTDRDEVNIVVGLLAKNLAPAVPDDGAHDRASST